MNRNFNYFKSVFICAVSMWFLVIPSISEALQMEGSSLVISAEVISAAGITESSTTYGNNPTYGEPLVGVTEGDMEYLYAGYWYTFTADITSPTAPSYVYDGLGDDIDFMYSSNTLSANWGVSIDTESGVVGYEYSISSTTPGSAGFIYWTLCGSTSVAVSGLTLISHTTYYFSVRAKNGVGLKSEIIHSDGLWVIVDTTPPNAITEVRDGLSADIDFTISLSTLSANWDAAADAESGISAYWYGIGISSSTTDVTNWTNIGISTYVTKTGLDLSVGTTYYFLVKTVNNVGLFSPVTSSDGILVNPTQIGPVSKIGLSASKDTRTAHYLDYITFQAKLMDDNDRTVITAGDLVTFRVCSGNYEHIGKRSSVNASSGIAKYDYSDIVTGEIRVSATVGNFTTSYEIINLVNDISSSTFYYPQDDGKTQIIIPAYTFSKNTEIRVEDVADTGINTSGKCTLIPNSGRQIKTYSSNGQETNITNFTNKVTIVLSYTDSGNHTVSGTNSSFVELRRMDILENSLSIFRINNGQVEMLDSDVHPDEDYVSAEIEHFSVYFLAAVIPSETKLYGSYPNPANSGETVYFVFDLKETQNISLKIYTISGELVRELVTDKEYAVGRYIEPWDTKNDSEQLLAPGIYICSFTSDKGKKLTKFVTIKK